MKEEQRKKEEDRKKVRESMIQYEKIIMEKHKPKVSQKKRDELQ